jgi:hypothetical protein
MTGIKEATSSAGPAGAATETRLDEAALADLKRSFRGDLIRLGDPSYEEHRRVWNGSIDRYPALIARCTSVQDVIAAVRFGRQSGLPVAVRSGGHSFPGLSVADGALVIDLRQMNAISVDPETRTVRVGAGAVLGELDQATQAHGLAVPAGIVTTTGVAGLTLGGGIGWLQRKYGLTIDNLLGVDLVTAEGELVHASESDNPDLFWGVRGAGSNFGIVTEFEFRAHPVGPAVLAGPILWAMEDSPKVLRWYREWITDVPDELTTVVVHRKAPPLPAIPTELHGKQVVMVIACYAGAVEDGERIVRPLRKFGSPLLDLCAPKPFLAHQAMFDPSFPRGRWYYFRSCDVDALTDEVIDITADRALQMRSPLNAFPIFHLGGAIRDVSDDATAFSGRGAGHTFNINATTESADGFAEEREWSRSFWSALEPYHTSVYVNFLMDEGQERIRQAYGADRYDRLKALKRKYDPENFFRLNQNIPPG